MYSYVIMDIFEFTRFFVLTIGYSEMCTNYFVSDTARPWGFCRASELIESSNGSGNWTLSCSHRPLDPTKLALIQNL